MKYLACFLIVLGSCTISAAQENAEKQARRITAIATDKTGRCMVSMSMADTLKALRPDMIAERRRLGLDYGSFFIAHELLANGISMGDLVSGLHAGKTVWEIGNERHMNWNRITADARKQNAKIEDYIYRHFLNKKNYEIDQQRDLQDKYDPARDAVRTDFAVSPKEMLDAQTRYIFWRDLAGKAQRSRGNLTLADEQAARFDHADVPGHDHDGGTIGPAAGGIPPR